MSETGGEEYIRSVTIGELSRLDGPVFLADYDPAWQSLFHREATRLRAILGDGLVRLEHVGSTSVPGLAAKPVVDILLVVPDSSDEAAYVPELEAAGYMLRVREPEWHQHRLLKGPDTDVNIHVFSVGCVEADRMVRFRDHLRVSDADRELYERTKRQLAQHAWSLVQDYADAKGTVVDAILSRAPELGGHS